MAQGPMTFEVATIKPTDPSTVDTVFHVSGRRVEIHNQTVQMLLMFAYDINAERIEGVPPWGASEHYDIDGTLETGTVGTREQTQQIVQALLADRFGMKLHHEQKPMQSYVLHVNAGGPKLASNTDAAAAPHMVGHAGEMKFTAMPMEGFANMLKFTLRRPVFDETGLVGRYDFALRWTPGDRFSEDPSAPPLLPVALKEQLGLKLDAERRPVDVVVVDSVQRPSAN